MEEITPQIKEFLEQQRLGFVATVSSDNSPNLSPKGTVFGWDEQHLIFADIRSPQTMANLKQNPRTEINVVDPLLRKGFRFRGISEILESGHEYEKMLSHYKNNGIQSKINAIVKIKVSSIEEINSPLYDLGFTEEQIKTKWKNHYLNL